MNGYSARGCLALLCRHLRRAHNCQVAHAFIKTAEMSWQVAAVHPPNLMLPFPHGCHFLLAVHVFPHSFNIRSPQPCRNMLDASQIYQAMKNDLDLSRYSVIFSPCRLLCNLRLICIPFWMYIKKCWLLFFFS